RRESARRSRGGSAPAEPPRVVRDASGPAGTCRHARGRVSHVPSSRCTMYVLARATRALLLGTTLLATVAPVAAAQTIDGIVVVGANQRAVATSKVALLDRRQNVVDTTTTDVFG